MPPRTKQNVIVVNNNVASRHLTNQYFNMKKLLKYEEDCPVCLESLMECKHCFTLLICGHSLHTKCFLDMINDQCPICKC